MEDSNVEVSTTTNGAPNGSRWNPTKEQIDLLENLYNQGIRTPTAEQIQQITAMLRAFGHIEGKNVFYWFQNHKARQRQKQKQEKLALYNHFHYQYPPLYLQHCPNVIYRPYYVPAQAQGDLGFHARSNPGSYFSAGPTAVHKRKSARTDKVHKAVVPTAASVVRSGYEESRQCGPETLDLFPLLPTGILQSSKRIREFSGAAPSGSPEIYCDGDSDSGGGASGDRTFFDFFRGNGHCETQ